MGRILITGGFGYVGGRVAALLQESRGDGKIRLLTRRPPEAWPTWAGACEVIQGDVLNVDALERAMTGVDIVIHLAALNEVESARDPYQALLVNAGGTLRVLEAAAAAGARRVVYLSTFHVYGPRAQSPITEETVPRPLHPYAISHRAAEDFVLAARDQGRLVTVVLRLSNGYGSPRDPRVNRWTLVFNDLCRQAVENHRLVLRSSGRQQRDFISLGDVARAVEHFVTLPDEQWEDGLFNLGTGCSLSILEIARRIAAEFEKCYSSSVTIESGKSSDPCGPGKVHFSIEKLKATGFVPSGNMSEEIIATFRICEHLRRDRFMTR